MSITRLTGLYSGLDTDSLVRAMTSKHQLKIDNTKKAQSKLKVQMDAWKDLNSKIYSFYSGVLSNGRMESSYIKNKITSSSDALTVSSAKTNDFSQKAQILNMAQTSSITSAKINKFVTKQSKVSELGLSSGSYEMGNKTIEIKDDTTIQDLTNAFKDNGINLSFDSSQRRFFINAKESGESNDIDLSTMSPELAQAIGVSQVAYLGDDGRYYSDKSLQNKIEDSNTLDAIKRGDIGVKINGQDAKLMLNGVLYQSNKNTMVIDDVSYTINRKTNENINISSSFDATSIKDNIKKLIDEYNTLTKELSTKYNQDNKLTALTDDEKYAMSDRQVDEWEKKLAETCLGKDEKINKVLQGLKNVTTNAITMKDGSSKYLSSFGISSPNYFNSTKEERNTLVIDEKKLDKAIEQDPSAVCEFFTSFANSLYDNLTRAMDSNSYSSMYKVYNDKEMSKQYAKYTEDITKLEKKLYEMEDKYYKQYTRMEQMLAQMQNNTNALNSLFNFNTK